MIGTDDGSSWWMLKGSCSGPRMTQISFDFSSKGGPPDLTGTWSMADFVESITWPDGNAWTTTPPTADSAAGVYDIIHTTATNTWHGIFLDAAHYVPDTYAGVRVLAETPQHTLHLVGSDDGTSWWYLAGNCHGVGVGESFEFVSKDYFRVDFSPKGGPSDLVAYWDHHSKITFPDGNTWYKPSVVGVPAQAIQQAQAAIQQAAAPHLALIGPAAVALPLALAAALAYGAVALRKRRAALQQQAVPVQL